MSGTNNQIALRGLPDEGSPLQLDLPYIALYLAAFGECRKASIVNNSTSWGMRCGEWASQVGSGIYDSVCRLISDKIKGRFAMKPKEFNAEQIVAVLKQAEAGVPVAELIRQVNMSRSTFYRWRKRYVGHDVGEVRNLMQLHEDNTLLKQLVVDLSLDKAMLQDVLSKKFQSSRGVGRRSNTCLPTTG